MDGVRPDAATFSVKLRYGNGDRFYHVEITRSDAAAALSHMDRATIQEMLKSEDSE